MAAYSRLNVVNACMAMLGDRGVNSLQDKHPMIPAALNKIEDANARVQAEYWWFNTEFVTLYPQQNDKTIQVPAEAVDVDSLGQFPRVTIRGRRLFNASSATDKFDGPVDVRMHLLVPYDDLPMIAKIHVAAQAKMDFQKDYDGDEQKARVLMQEIADTHARLNATHTRNARVNLLSRPSTAVRLGAIAGGRVPWQAAGYRTARHIGG